MRQHSLPLLGLQLTLDMLLNGSSTPWAPGTRSGAGHNLANWKDNTDMYGLQEGTDDESRAEFLDFVPE